MRLHLLIYLEMNSFEVRLRPSVIRRKGRNSHAYATIKALHRNPAEQEVHGGARTGKSNNMALLPRKQQLKRVHCEQLFNYKTEQQWRCVLVDSADKLDHNVWNHFSSQTLNLRVSTVCLLQEEAKSAEMNFMKLAGKMEFGQKSNSMNFGSVPALRLLQQKIWRWPRWSCTSRPALQGVRWMF